MAFPILSVIVLTPLLGALIIVVVPKEKLLAVRCTAAAVSFISLAFSIYTCLAYNRASGGMQFAEKLDWIRSIGVSYSLGVDGISAPMILLTGIVIFTGVLVSWSIEERVKQFFINLLLLAAGAFGVFCSRNLFFFFLFYELAVLPMFLLIVVWGSGDKVYGAYKLTLQKIGGSVLVFIGILALYGVSGQNTFDIAVLSKAAYPASTENIIFLVLFLGFGVLALLWPLHTWAPIGHAAAPTAASMFLAGVSMKMGAYGILRVAIGILPEGAKELMPYIAILAIINIVYGALVAMAQTDFKFIIGYSSVSHMGLVILGLATLNRVGISGAVFQMFSHGVMTAALFALVGLVYGRTHTRDIRELGGLATKIPLVAGIFVLAGLTSLGLPGTSGFVAEFLVFMGAFKAYKIITVLAIAGSAITAVYILRVVRRVFFGPLGKKWESLTDATSFELVPLVILAGAQIIFGLYPTTLVSLINAGVKSIVGRLGGSLL